MPSDNNNKAKAAEAPKNALKVPMQRHGARFKEFCQAADKNPNIKKQMKLWLAKKYDGELRTTATGAKHRVVKSDPDLRVCVPKSENFEKGKDGNGLHSMLQAQGWTQEKITLTWVVCYVNDIVIEEDTESSNDYECSHRCCEYDTQGKRMSDGYRCIDSSCLTWESKSVNQERANVSCRKMCHCGCGRTVCEANKVHNPPCK